MGRLGWRLERCHHPADYHMHRVVRRLERRRVPRIVVRSGRVLGVLGGVKALRGLRGDLTLLEQHLDVRVRARRVHTVAVRRPARLG